jgi:hypothetical protein
LTAQPLSLHDPRVRAPALLVALAAAAACVSATSTWSRSALAAEATPEQLQFAAHEHDLGYRAYVAKQYDEAATHFENAFFAAPNPAELRSAVRAHREAGQLARAATLAAIGQRKYPDDAALAKLADETLGEARPKVFEVRVASSAECNVAVDEKVVSAEKVREFRFYVDPGKHELVVGWSEGRTKRVLVEAKAGGSQALTLEPPPVPPKPKPAVDRGVVASSGAAAPQKPFAPVVFFTAAGLTAVGVGVTVWSGLDAQKNPGTDAVRTGCVGQGESCALYQQGLGAQRRTNIMLGVTGGLAAVTAVVGVFFTQWSRPDRPAAGLRVEPALGLCQAGVRGTF